MTGSSIPANKLLNSLPPPDLAALRPHLKPVDLLQDSILFEIGGAVDQVYFPHSGVVSLVVSLATGETIECAMIGRESAVGGSSALGGPISICKAIVQIGLIGSGYLWIDDISLEKVDAKIEVTKAPVLGKEEAPIKPPSKIAADAIRCPECGYRNNKE